MASESITGGRDRLSSLPPELLTQVFVLAHEDKKSAPRGPLSRALRPFDTAGRLRRVEIHSPEQLERFVRLLEQDPALPRLVQELATMGGYDPYAVAAAARWRTATLPPFQRLLNCLPHLTRLELDAGCLAYILYTLSPHFLAHPLSCLRQLSLALYITHDDPFDPAHLEHLGARQSLSSLCLSFHDPDESHSLDAFDPLRTSSTTLPHIRRLHLMAFDRLPLAAAYLAKACPNVHDLTLEACADPPGLSPIIPHFPTTLRSLSLVTFTRIRSSPPVDVLLPRFTSLEHLHMGEGTFHAKTLFDSLRALPSLSSLSFGLDATVSVAGLRRLVAGPERHRALRRLTLDNVERGDRGSRLAVELDGELHLMHEDSSKHTAPDWFVPRFSDPHPFFSTKGVERLAEVAVRNGVHVSGAAVDSIEIFREHEEEALVCSMKHGRSTGDFSGVWEVLGAEAGMEYLLKVGRAES
ncbi:hypothetical protein JCM10213_001363 [Rhodosporidiobolus nylandii]